ncbi:reverse transcriptase [Plakobranchus ocellatus]|uniref:Reverse transcriptase n=1 Tax=Plakobranchus ocellatus TaxID=259542 RepID=A0AAV4AGB9_9GAST|nr:reverse transcriptase [Plakobranchus ocellatus]
MIFYRDWPVQDFSPGRTRHDRVAHGRIRVHYARSHRVHALSLRFRQAAPQLERGAGFILRNLFHVSSVRCSNELSRMSFKPRKPRTLSLRKGNLDEDNCFKIASQDKPRITQEPVKSLGTW